MTGAAVDGGAHIGDSDKAADAAPTWSGIQ